MAGGRQRPPRATLAVDDRERERAKQRAYTYTRRCACTACGGPMGIGSRPGEGGICRTCRLARADDLTNKVAALWRDGLPDSAIASRLGLTRDQVKNYVQRARARGEDLERRPDPARADRVVAMWAAGLTHREIGEALGISAAGASMLVQRLRAKGYDLPRRADPAR